MERGARRGSGIIGSREARRQSRVVDQQRLIRLDTFAARDPGDVGQQVGCGSRAANALLLSQAQGLLGIGGLDAERHLILMKAKR